MLGGQLGMANNGSSREFSISIADSDSALNGDGDGDGQHEDRDEIEESADRSLIISTPTINEYFQDHGIEVSTVYCGSYHSLCMSLYPQFRFRTFESLAISSCVDDSR